MAEQAWVNLLNKGAPWQTTQGTVLNTAVTAVISPRSAGPQDFVLPGQDNGLQWYVGMHLHIRARGSATTGGTTTNLTVAVAIGPSGGATGLATALCPTAATALGTGAASSLGWGVEADVVCTALGSTGTTLVSDGIMWMSQAATPGASFVANAVVLPMVYTSTAFNTYTAGTAIALNGTLSAAFGSITCNRFMVDQLN
jgi:hypothetical protein